MGCGPSSSSVMQCNNVLGSLHTRDWEPMTVTLQASHWWKRRSRSKFASHYAWGTNKVCECMICSMDVKSTWIPTWITSRGHLDYFQKPPLGSRPNTKPGDRGTPNAHNCWFILVYHVWGPTWVEIHWTSIWLRVRSHMASHYTWRSVTTTTTWFWRCVATAFGQCLLGSHNFTVMALDSCVKWPFTHDFNVHQRKFDRLFGHYIT